MQRKLKKIVAFVLVSSILMGQNLVANAEVIAGCNPFWIVSHSGYVTDDTYYIYFPYSYYKHISVDAGTKVIVLNCDSINGYKKVMIGDEIAWVSEESISEEKPYTKYNVSCNGKKPYMDWECITNTSSDQFKFQQVSLTAENGIRKHKGRYEIAIGSHFTTKIGTKIDLIILHKDGSSSKIKCVLGDCKADCDTDTSHMYASDGSVAEFIVNTSSLPNQARTIGDLSYISDKFEGTIIKVLVY